MIGRFGKARLPSRKSLGVQLFGITFVGIVALVSVLGYASYAASKSILKEKVSQASQETLAQATDKLDFLLSTYAGITRQLLVDTVLREDLVAFSTPGTPLPEKQAAQDRITDRINSVVSSEPNIMAVRFMPKNLDYSNALSTTGASALQMSEAGEAWLNRMNEAQGEVVYVPTLNEGLFGYSPEPSLTFGRLLKNLQSPEAEFIVLIEVRGQVLSDIFANSSIGEKGQLLVVTDEGAVAYAASPELVGQAPPTVNAAEALVLEQPSQVTGWHMEGIVPVKDLARDSGRILRLTLWMAAAAAIAALLIGYLLARKVGRPLEKLCELMEHGENGDLSVRMEQRGPSEIARLARHFNRMMERIGLLVSRSNMSAEQLVRAAKALKSVSSETAASAGEIAQVSGMISSGAMNLAKEAEHGIVLTEAIGARMNAVTATNARLEASAARVHAVSHQGAASMAQLMDKADETGRLSLSLADKVGNLKASTGAIRSIMNLMNEISKKTNILSLNASIEAARAGALGKSFAVVADEIRQLAAQSKQSIGDVQRMTEEIQRGIDVTAAELGAIAPLLREQNDAVKEAADVFGEVKSQMDIFVREIEQSTASVAALDESQRTLISSIENVSAVSQQSAASTEEVATLASGQQNVSDKLVTLSVELESLSEHLLEVLVRFGNKPASTR